MNDFLIYCHFTNSVNFCVNSYLFKDCNIQMVAVDDATKNCGDVQHPATQLWLSFTSSLVPAESSMKLWPYIISRQ